MLLTAWHPVSASIIDLGIDVENEHQSKNGARSVTPSVQVEAFNDVLSIDVNRCLGNVQVSVMAIDRSSSISNTYYINGHNVICLDFTGYSEGLYQMTVTLGNGDVYLGSFRIE